MLNYPHLPLEPQETRLLPPPDSLHGMIPCPRLVVPGSGIPWIHTGEAFSLPSTACTVGMVRRRRAEMAGLGADCGQDMPVPLWVWTDLDIFLF